MKKVFALCLIMCLTFSLTSCSSNGSTTNNDYNSDYTPSYTTPQLSESAAISAVKSEFGLARQIADLHNLKFFSQPEYGTCTATKNYTNGGWKVTLKGTISGYTDDYKKNFSYKNRFTVTALVSDTGLVSNLQVKKY